MRSIRRTLLAAAATAALVLAPSAAFAGERPADAGRPSDAGRADVATEDTDGNDGGTPDDVADDGDDAHPSGRDRSVEHGRSGNRGRAQSDPDDDGRGPDRTNGGADQPDGPGGVDLADQDGNNGCGNDDDFEDDNEGHCGRPQPAATTSGASTSGAAAGSTATGNGTDRSQDTAVATSGRTAPVAPETAVAGETRAVEAPAATPDRPAGTPAEAPVETAVLGIQLDRPAPTPAPAGVVAAGTAVQPAGLPAVLADALPRTGADAGLYALVALLALAGGTVAVRRGRNA